MRVAARRVAEREFENGVRDFLTVVMTTPLIRPGEEYLRVALAVIPLARLGARQWSAGAGTEAEWAALRLTPGDLRDEVLMLLRATRRAVSESADGRAFMQHGRPAPTGYSDPEHQASFARLVELSRAVTKVK